MLILRIFGIFIGLCSGGHYVLLLECMLVVFHYHITYVITGTVAISWSLIYSIGQCFSTGVLLSWS